jgi:methyl-accepting chemotaxis protein
VAASVETAEKAIADLFDSVEVIQEEMSQFTIGHGQLEQVLKTAFESRDACRQVLERLAAQGIDIFDRNYVPVAGTNPPKFRTVYDEHFEREMQGCFDRVRQTTPGAIYALAVDNHGYLPCHHSEFSLPPTGNPEHDLVNSRHKRIYRSSRAEIRRAEHTSYCLLQTYLRDTGEILNDLSVPIHVNGRHWGNFIFGLKPEQFIQ